MHKTIKGKRLLDLTNGCNKAQRHIDILKTLFQIAQVMSFDSF